MKILRNLQKKHRNIQNPKIFETNIWKKSIPLLCSIIYKKKQNYLPHNYFLIKEMSSRIYYFDAAGGTLVFVVSLMK